MRIVIFGANGQTGRLLTEQALAAGHDVAAVTRRPAGFPLRRDRLTIIDADVHDAPAVGRAVEGADVVLSALGVPLADGDNTVHVTELAHGLAYWGRWQPVPGAATGLRLPVAGGAPVPSAADALAAVPRIADQSGGVRERLGRLAGLPGWPAGPQSAEGTFARAVDHGDEHVIKFADSAADAYARTGNPDALAAALRAADLIER